MARRLMMLAAVLTMAAWSSAALAGEGCAHAKGAKAKTASLVSDSESFKDGGALLYGVRLVSEKLFDALAAIEVDKDKVRCPACKTALETDGQCEHCHIGAVAGKVYRSPIAYRLAKGKVITEEMKASCGCEACKKAYAQNGTCEHCKVGFVAGRMYSADKDYDAALAAHKILERSAKAATMCEDCAVAMVTDGACDHCKVKFKDGQMARADK